MTKPLVPWDSEDATHPSLVWWNKFDNRYLAEVHRVADYLGELYVFDHDKKDKQIACWPVGLSYGAMFGPDIADVAEWEEKVIDFIDNTYGG